MWEWTAAHIYITGCDQTTSTFAQHSWRNNDELAYWTYVLHSHYFYKSSTIYSKPEKYMENKPAVSQRFGG